MPNGIKDKVANIAGKVTLIYVLLSVFWVAGTDRLVAAYVKNQELNLALQTYKGWLFVVITGTLLFVLLKREELVVRKIENRSKILLQAVPDIIFRFNIDGVFVDYSTEDVKSLAVPPEQFLGKNIIEVLPQNIALPMLEAVKKALQTGKVQTFEYQIETPKGLMFSEARVVAKGEEVVAFVRDITEKSRFIEALKLSEEKFSQIFKNNPEIMLIGSMDSLAIWDTNQAFSTILGYELSEVLGRTLAEVGITNDSELEQKKVFVNRELNLKRKDGKTVRAMCTLSTIDIGGAKGFLLSGESKEPEADLDKLMGKA